ncbi:DNA topoisomerase I [Bacteroidetes bacterium UKL13-3]|jgi:DNA topoisomerase-1|nr:DNA topoisomerase I [Bacteroidetes bacterium UKL13-3]HCP93035.1 type I DNA topoisomerase [Bacteroidota bacterium]
MTKNLVIVESPAKAKTIEKFLGKDFTVRSCYGHIRDLAKGDNAIQINNNFNPIYEVSADKKAIVAELKKLSKDADMIWLASDEDREGEAISWHLSEVLKLDDAKTKRIVFHEITKPAILKAIENPRKIDKHLVDAQQARRVLDRLVGFELSPVLWKKIKGNLSAGRVQSVAVRLIVEREREINAFNYSSAFKVTAKFNVGGKQMEAELGKRFDTEKEAQAFLESCKNASYVINQLETKPAEKSPSAPFTTSTLQQEASRKLGYSVSQTMQIAQKLYEHGFITYMRTDSVNLSELAIANAKETISRNYGERYSNPRRYTTKNDSAQEAHEAIRPTYFENQNVDGTPQEKRLYDLIWKRSIASQMSKAQIDRTTANIGISTNGIGLIATGEVLTFDGFLKVYMESTDDEGDDDNSKMLPPLKVGENLNLIQIDAIERFTRPAPRYTEASLVKKLEELGIGRPSTYAPTISTVQKRGYVVKEDREGKERKFTSLSLSQNQISRDVLSEKFASEKSKLFPSDIGMIVTDFLSKHFENIMDYNFTALVEKEFDEIAQGQLQWNKMIESFYTPFHKEVAKTTETAERQSGERLLGTDPKTGKNIYAKVGRFGPFVQLGENSDDEALKPQYGKLLQGQRVDSITLEEAIELFKLPRTIGEFEGKEVSVNIGRFGPYVKWGEEFISLPKGEEIMEVNLAKAIEVIAAKQTAEAPVGMFDNKPITKGKGRFGPFIKWNDMFINVPRAYNLDTLTQPQMNELIEKKIDKESNRFIQQWPAEKISIENGRWGAFIRLGKNMIKIGRKKDGEKYTNEELATISIDDVKKLIEAEMPDAFKAKKAAPKKATAKKTAAKKVAPRKVGAKKAKS